MKKSFYRSVALLTMLIAFFAVPLTVCAEEQTVFEGQVVTLTEAADAFREMNTDSELVHSFSAGDSVFVTKEEDGWYQIFYQGEGLYIPNSQKTDEAVEAASEEAVQQSMEITKEFDAKQKSDEAFVNTYVQQEKSKSNSRMWIVIISALVVAIIAVSVVIAIKSKKENSNK